MKNFVGIIKKNKKPILIAGGVLLAGIIVLLVIKAKKKNAMGELPSGSNTGSQPVTPGISWPLKRKPGSQTSAEEQIAISKLQRYLNKKISYVDEPLEVDGFFGEKTEKQVQLFLGVKTVSYSLFQEIIGG